MYRLDYFANFPINKKAQMLLSQDFPNANPFSLQDSQSQKNAKQQIKWFIKNKDIIWINGLNDIQNNVNIILEGVKGEEK